MIGSRVRALVRRDPVEVACATDRRGLPHCATMLHSLLVNQRRRVQVDLIAASDVTDESIAHLTRMITDHGGTLIVHRVSGELPEPASWREVLPPERDRITVLDNDVIVTGSLDPAVAHLEGPGGPKPWHPRADPRARDLYWAHREQTPWAAENALTHPMREFFDGLRITRHELHDAKGPVRSGTRRHAIITIVRDEGVFLPVWLGYYSRFFAPADIYVLDHQTTDGSTDRDGFVRIPVSHESVDHTWMVRTIESLQHELLDGDYDTVLVTDVDELVAPDPRQGTLGDYLDRFDEDFVNCLGYEVLQLPDEPPLDTNRPVLEQRRWWFANDGYDKPALATVPMTWEPGFHSRADGEMNLDPDLRLIHLHRMDYRLCRDRHRRRLELAWDERDVDAGWASHNRIADDEQQFNRWFYEDSCFEHAGIHIDPEPIPAAWRGLF